MKEINEYIKSSWHKTIRKPTEDIPFPYTSPSIEEMFLDFYYWDAYFINKALYLDGYAEQAENNLNNIEHFIQMLGYMPNANTLTNRSQPPLFTKAVYELYEYKKDVAVIEKYLPTILKEYDFWMTKRMLPCGLNTYSDNATLEDLELHYKYLAPRVQEFRESKEEQLALAHDIIAIAESGLDFNMRFATKYSKIDIGKFIQVDINCILYDVEQTIAKMFALTGDQVRAEVFLGYAADRKRKMDEMLLDKESGFYLDYNTEEKCFSKIVTAISFYPYTFGVSKDKEAAKRLLARLEREHGLCVGENRGEDAVYFQWDYPCMWPAATCLTYMGLRKIGLNEEAERIAQKYNAAVLNNYLRTGKIWEKYDAVTGGIGQTEQEYGTPEMLGWSAAVYRYFFEELR